MKVALDKLLEKCNLEVMASYWEKLLLKLTEVWNIHVFRQFYTLFTENKNETFY